ncbi:DUF2164 domain-containing protein [Bacillus sp. S/N-304-OC-R1]|uniref:DUF2164 domain-containing protein n=1 Tax=Bacillus sp. S/N-304-OC-R1 TaxID=2758034 RepID=UPI001C8E019A|nr:DUF2164 domain-containing protein [Bacillus sp. S/N-304-OC-R1]MBY0121676.1 DUF2164 domain-containing protein [Bacillus sp. S/N-304-OC-R1]
MFIKLTKDQQQLMISDIQEFFLHERDEEISEFAAERFLFFIKESLAPHFYNAAVLDAKHVLEQQYSALEEEILTLERPINK